MGIWGAQKIIFTRDNTKKWVQQGPSAGVISYVRYTGKGILWFARMANDGGGARNSHLSYPFVATDQNVKGWKDVVSGANVTTNYAALNAWSNKDSSLVPQRLINYAVQGLCVAEYSYSYGLPFNNYLEIGIGAITAGAQFTVWAIIEGAVTPSIIVT